MRRFVERADSFERPQRVDGARAVAGGHALFEDRRGVILLVIGDQSLGGQAPKLIATIEGLDDFRSRSIGERLDRTFRTVLPNHAIDATMTFIAQIMFGHVSAAAAGFGFDTSRLDARCRVVLNDEAVEINDPNSAVRTDIGKNRRHPLVAAGYKVETVIHFVTGSITFNVHDADELGRRLSNERFALKTWRQRVADHERVPGGGRVSTEVIDHANIWRVGMHAKAG